MIKFSTYYYPLLNALYAITLFMTTFHHKLGKGLLLITLLFAIVQHVKLPMLVIRLKEPLFIVMLTTLAYMTLSLIWTPDFHEGQGNVKNYLIYFILPIFTFSLISHKKQIHQLIKVFILAMFVNELISYSILFGFFGGSAAFDGYPTPFIHHSLYSIFVIIALFIIGYEFIYTKKILHKFIYLFFLLTMSGNLVISGGRNGQVTLILVIFVFALNYFRHSYKKALLLLLGPLLVFFIAYQTYDQFNDRLNKIYTDTEKVFLEQNYDTSFGNRLFSYILAEQYLKDYNYIRGEGAGSTRRIKNEIIDNNFSQAKQTARQYAHFHQYYISTLVQYGIIGLLLLLLFFYYLFKLKINNPEINYIRYVILLIMIFSNLSDGMMFTRSTMLIFALFIGLILAQYHIEQKDTSLLKEEHNG